MVFIFQIRNREVVRSILVWILILSILVIFNGCGFQLKRSLITLPKAANSLQVSQVKNNSHRPGLNIRLWQLIADRLYTNSIVPLTSSLAELTLEFTILDTKSSKNKQSLQDGTQTYIYQFSVSGLLSLRDNRNSSFIYKELKLSSTYSLETASSDLTESEIEAGFRRSLEVLSGKIVTKLSQTF
jgi:outer membrane lipopolysaccharide assembly protein LptE/RlpB